MNERLTELYRSCRSKEALASQDQYKSADVLMGTEVAKFAELIVKECATLLFDESERLYAYSSECDNMRESDEAEVVAEKCVDLITMIEQHFGVEQ